MSIIFIYEIYFYKFIFLDDKIFLLYLYNLSDNDFNTILLVKQMNNNIFQNQNKENKDYYLFFNTNFSSELN